MATIRQEQRDDIGAIHALEAACFPTDAEARLGGGFGMNTAAGQDGRATYTAGQDGRAMSRLVFRNPDSEFRISIHADFSNELAWLSLL
jgi:hypothetical protein